MLHLGTGQISLVNLHTQPTQSYLASNVRAGCDNTSDIQEHSCFLALQAIILILQQKENSWKKSTNFLKEPDSEKQSIAKNAYEEMYYQLLKEEKYLQNQLVNLLSSVFSII